MKISKRFVSIALICITAAVLVGVVLADSANRVEAGLRRTRVAAEIVESIGGLRFLTMEYALHPQERVEVQWRAVHENLGELLATASRTDDDRTGADKILHVHNELLATFSRLSETLHEQPASDANKLAVIKELKRRLTGALINRLNAMIREAILLRQAASDSVADSQHNALVMVFWLMGALVVVVSASMLFVYRGVARPLERLKKGAEHIEAGNLDHVIGLTGADEIGDVGRAFDQMTAKLKATTVSRDELVVEVEQRKRAQDLNRRLAQIVESSDDAIASKNMAGIITSWNAGAEKLFGYSALEAIGKPMAMLIPPDRPDEEATILARVARGETTDHLETVRNHKDGNAINVSVTISPLPDGKGNVIGASSIARDITDRKLAEAKLHEQLERLNLLHHITRAIGERQDLSSIFQVVVRSLEDQLSIDFCCVCLYRHQDNSLIVSYVGARSETLALDLALTEQAHIDIDENGLSRCVRGHLVYEPDISQVTFAFPQRLARSGLRSLVLAPLIVESEVFGVLVAARREAQCFTSAECEFLQQLSGHVALASHHARLNKALQKAYDELRETQQSVMQQERLRSLGQMASGIAHDINNAVSPISLYTESLLENEPNLSQRARNYLETIQRAIDDVAQTVARMGEFYRQREPQLSLSPILLNSLVHQVLEFTRVRWRDMPQQNGVVIDLQTDLAQDLPPIMGAENEIREALTNLVFNAVDAMPSGGVLTVRTLFTGTVPTGEAESPLVEVVVEDTGIGMDEVARERCLEPFYTTKGDRGTGLGLAMVYGMVQRHSAHIRIRSDVGKGTAITLAFAPTVTSMSQSVPVLQGALARLRILIVDDDPLILKSMRDTLEPDGHVVTTANGGQAGIDIFCNVLPPLFDVVITDLGMPHVDGRQVAAAIKRASRSTPVILLTGWGQRLVSEGDVPASVDIVLSKPPRLIKLREALLKCCPPSGQSPGVVHAN